MNEKRMIIYQSEIIRVTGLHKRSVMRLIKKIRGKYGLAERSYLPLEIFCEYTSLNIDSVRRALENQ